MTSKVVVFINRLIQKEDYNMSLYFKNEDYKERALKDAKKEYVNKHSVIDAFFLLIEHANEGDLSNVCELIQEYYRSIRLSMKECYDLTQGISVESLTFDEDVKSVIYDCAYKCLESGRPLGNRTIMQGKINTSDWMAHCLFEGKLAGQLAAKMKLDVSRAQKLGILHDYGRKISQDANHITRGYEELSDKGWNEDSIGCLTHSFLAGNRCSWNDSPEDGFYVDDEGVAKWELEAQKDDLTVFLENYNFSVYDDILNIADLMATSKAIVSPAERIADIATRRKEFDPKNRLYFLAELSNKLIEMLENIGGTVPEDMREKVKAKKGVTLNDITIKFERASKLFFEQYQKIV